jgi:hypothetical protein
MSSFNEVAAKDTQVHGMMKIPTHMWCPYCKDIVPIMVTATSMDILTGNYIYDGELVCKPVQHIIATMYKEKR